MTDHAAHGAPVHAGSLLERLRRATLGHYDVYAELGAGGMATVFLALDLALDRKVAIKVMSPSLSDSLEALERFREEARVAASLNHPNIIPIYSVGDDPELAYFVMRFVEGRTLDSVVRDQGAQSTGLVTQHGWLLVMDFGIAKRGVGKGWTLTGTPIGTPSYMSPEQFNGEPASSASDQYALGAVAFELLTGRPPYVGSTLEQVIRGHLIDDVPLARTIRPDTPASIESAIARMLAKKPVDRFPTMSDAVAALGDLTPSVAEQARTEIMLLAREGAELQPRMSVPVSPVLRGRNADESNPRPESSGSVSFGGGGSGASRGVGLAQHDEAAGKRVGDVATSSHWQGSGRWLLRAGSSVSAPLIARSQCASRDRPMTSSSRERLGRSSGAWSTGTRRRWRSVSLPTI